MALASGPCMRPVREILLFPGQAVMVHRILYQLQGWFSGFRTDSYCAVAQPFQDLCDFRLADIEILGTFQRFSHLAGICLLVRLCTKRMYCRSFGLVQHLGLNKSLIDIYTHLTA